MVLKPLHLAAVAGWYFLWAVFFVGGLLHTKNGPSAVILIDLLLGSTCFWLRASYGQISLLVGNLCFVHVLLIAVAGLFETGSFSSCVHTASSIAALFVLCGYGIAVLLIVAIQSPNAVHKPYTAFTPVLPVTTQRKRQFVSDKAAVVFSDVA